MLFARYGVFALVANTFWYSWKWSDNSTSKVYINSIIRMIIHITIVYGGLFKIFTKLSVKPF